MIIFVLTGLYRLMPKTFLWGGWTKHVHVLPTFHYRDLPVPWGQCSQVHMQSYVNACINIRFLVQFSKLRDGDRSCSFWVPTWSERVRLNQQLGLALRTKLAARFQSDPPKSHNIFQTRQAKINTGNEAPWTRHIGLQHKVQEMLRRLSSCLASFALL